MTPEDKINKLEDEVSLYKEKYKEAAPYKEKYENAVQSYDELLFQLRQMQRAQFGSTSEKYSDIFSGQQALFEAEELLDDSGDDDDDPDPDGRVPVKGHRRKKKSGVSTYDHLPTREEIISVDEADRHCECGCEKKVLGYEDKWLLHYVPAVFERILQKREKVSCPRCKDAIVTAPVVPQLLPKSEATEDLLAQVVINKCLDRQPLYHLEKCWSERFNVKISRQTMAGWIIASAKKMTPLISLIKEAQLSYPISAVDATSIQVLKEEDRKATTKSYMYCMRGGPPDKRSVLYDYNATSHKKFVKDWYADYQGSIHSDAENIFVSLNEEDFISMSYCNAHARRKFEKITKTVHSEGLAHTAMRYFKRLYKIEAKAKSVQMCPEERLELRQRESMPIVDSFHKWLVDSEKKVLPKSPIGKALRYSLKHWTGLTQFLDNGELEIDNNLTEQQIKPFVMARKNFLFSYSVEGAHALATYFSLIQTAKAHNIEPCAYLTTVFKEIPTCYSFEDYEIILPWNVAKRSEFKEKLKVA